jgi:hypothetical protein
MSAATRWRIAFLGLTGLVIGMEILAACDASPATRPWTTEIVGAVPMEATFAAIGALVLWLPIHFWVAYRRKRERAARDNRT